MSIHDTDDLPVLDALKHSLDGVTMPGDVERIVSLGRARRRRRRITGLAGAAAAVSAVGLALSPGLVNPSTAPPSGSQVHLSAVAYTVDEQADGSIRVTWSKDRYFADHAGLEQALRTAGFPVTIKEGSFCLGPDDDPALDASGLGPGARELLHGGKDGAQPGEKEAAGKEAGKDGGTDQVSFVFRPSSLPAGKQLFIGFLDQQQLAVTGGHPGSVERLVSAAGPLTCTSELPHFGA